MKRIEVTFPTFLDLPLSAITAGELERWRAARLKQGRKPATLNRDLTCIKAVLNRAVDWGIIEVNPLAKVKPARVDTQSKVRYLTDDEEARLRDALDERETRIRRGRESGNMWRQSRGHDLMPDLNDIAFADHLKPMVLISINTGLRRGELFSLTWDNVDLEKGMATIVGERAKSRRTRHVPLNSEVLKILKAWKPQQVRESSLVFPGENGARFNNTKKAWAALLRLAQISHFRWHDMRHHFASKLAMAAVDLNTIRELLGHSDYAMTLRYAHLAPEHKRVAVEALVK